MKGWNWLELAMVFVGAAGVIGAVGGALIALLEGDALDPTGHVVGRGGVYLSEDERQVSPDHVEELRRGRC